MKKLLCALIAGSSLFLSSCGDSPESLIEDQIEYMEEMVEILEGVNDGDDAEDAIEDIKELGEKMAKVAEKAKELEKDMTDTEKEESKKLVEEKFEKALVKVSGEISGEMAKLDSSGNVGAGDVKKAAMEAMNKAF